MTSIITRVAAYSHVHGFDVLSAPAIPEGYYGEQSSDEEIEMLRAHGIDFEPEREETIDIVKLRVPLSLVVIVWGEDMALIETTTRTMLAHVAYNHVLHYPADVPSTTIHDRDVPNPEEPGAPTWTDVLNNLDEILREHSPYLT